MQAQVKSTFNFFPKYSSHERFITYAEQVDAVLRGALVSDVLEKTPLVSDDAWYGGSTI